LLDSKALITAEAAEAEKARLTELSKLPGVVKGLNELAQLDSSPLWESLNKVCSYFTC